MKEEQRSGSERERLRQQFERRKLAQMNASPVQQSWLPKAGIDDLLTVPSFLLAFVSFVSDNQIFVLTCLALAAISLCTLVIRRHREVYLSSRFFACAIVIFCFGVIGWFVNIDLQEKDLAKTAGTLTPGGTSVRPLAVIFPPTISLY